MLAEGFMVTLPWLWQSQDLPRISADSTRAHPHTSQAGKDVFFPEDPRIFTQPVAKACAAEQEAAHVANLLRTPAAGQGPAARTGGCSRSAQVCKLKPASGTRKLERWCLWKMWFYWHGTQHGLPRRAHSLLCT